MPTSTEKFFSKMGFSKVETLRAYSMTEADFFFLLAVGEYGWIWSVMAYWRILEK